MSKRMPVLPGFEARSVKLMAAWSLVLIAGAAYPDGVIHPPSDQDPHALTTAFNRAASDQSGQPSHLEAPDDLRG